MPAPEFGMKVAKQEFGNCAFRAAEHGEDGIEAQDVGA